MNKKICFLLLAFVVLLLVLTQTARAMSSENYILDWYTPLTTGGGGKSSSTNYSAELSIGQSAIGSAESANYQVGLGYWGALVELIRSWYINLPLIIR